MKNLEMKKAILILMGFVFVVSLKAQDVHLSQFYASPSSLNPALTGMMSELIRANVSYREQWSSVVPYSTIAASAERRLDIGNYDRVGIGLQMFNDKTGDVGGLNTFKLYASSSFQKVLRTNSGNFVISSGMQIGFFQKGLYGEFIAPTDAVDNYINDRGVVQMDINGGGLIAFKLKGKSTFFLGGSIFHLNKPKESFFDGSDNRLSQRYVINGGAMINNDSRPLFVTPNFIFMSQGGAKEINLGANIHYDFARISNNDLELILGGWSRLNDAVIAYAGMRVGASEFGLSYDMNNSGLSTSVGGQGAFEFSFKYIVKDKFIKLQACPSLRI